MKIETQWMKEEAFEMDVTTSNQLQKMKQRTHFHHCKKEQHATTAACGQSPG
jgi:hypothetical protein